MIRPFRTLAAMALAATLTLGLAPAPARAQEPPPAEGEGASEGRPWDAYIATTVLASLALFIVAKSARR